MYESPVEARLRELLTPAAGPIHRHRPRGEWIVDTLHGRRPIRPEDVWPPRAGAPPAPAPGPAGPVSAQAGLLDEGAGWLETAEELERGLAQLAGARARALASFARCRPSAWDRKPGECGAASAVARAARPESLTTVSEWAVAEVAARLRLSSTAASGLLAESVELVDRLPGTLAALERGDISWLHARALVELLRPVSEEKRGQVEQRVLPRAPRQTVAQLRECTKRAIARIDAGAAVQRVAQAVQARKVTRQPGQDGMETLSITLPAPVGRACHDALRAYAEACATGADGQPDPRGLDERMVDCFADLILRPDAQGRSPVRVLLTLVAGVGTLTGVGEDADAPGEVDGEPVPAVLVRELAYSLGLIPRPAPCPELADLPPTEALDDDGPDPDPSREDPGPRDREQEALAGTALAGTALARLLDARRIAGTALAERPRIAVVDELTGCLLALTDSVELRGARRDGRGLGPPGETDGYRPAEPLDRFVRLRDRRCRFPGCRARARKSDLDHLVPYPDGPTAHDNLEALCEFHHRLSHQAPGWRLGGSSDGGLVWTLPGGATVTTVPPRFGTDDGSAPSSAGEGSGASPAAPAAPADWRSLTPEDRRQWLRDLICGRPPRPGDPPAPF